MDKTYHIQDFLKPQDNQALENLMNDVLPKCLGIAKRYCKTDEQSNVYAKKCFLSALKELLLSKNEEFSEQLFLKQYIICLTKTVLSERTGTLIADTTIIAALKRTEANLFSSSDYYKTLPVEELIHYIRKLNPLQQVIYNLIVIDNFSANEVAEILQHSELSIKALIEKARYNLYTSIKTSI